MRAYTAVKMFFAAGRNCGMLDFSCPVCGKQYHADDQHIGKSIRCNAPGCEEIITIAWQDGRYTTSDQQIKTVNQRRSKWIDEIRKNGVVLFKSKTNRGVVVPVVVVLLVGIGLVGYKYSVHRDSSKLKSEEPVTLSPDEVAGSSAAPARASVHPPSGDRATTFDMSTAVGLDDKPINQNNSSSPRWLKSDDDGTIYYPAKPISKRVPKADAEGIRESESPGKTFNIPVERERMPPPYTISLPTGTRIIPDQATTGRGELVAINGTGADACVIVLDSNTQERVRKVYIKSQDSFTLGHLNPGNYNVLFATGVDWDNTGERFNRNASYFEFGKVLSFKEEGGYEQHTITLNPVANGNVRRRSISETEFHALTAMH
jgi:hypothetical protein